LNSISAFYPWGHAQKALARLEILSSIHFKLPMSATIKDAAMIPAPITKNLVLLLVIVSHGLPSHKNVLKKPIFSTYKKEKQPNHGWITGKSNCYSFLSLMIFKVLATYSW